MKSICEYGKITSNVSGNPHARKARYEHGGQMYYARIGFGPISSNRHWVFEGYICENCFAGFGARIKVKVLN